MPLFNLELLQDFCCFAGRCQRLQTMLLLIGLFLVSSCLYGKLERSEFRVAPNKRVISRHFGQRVVLGEIKEAAVGGWPLDCGLFHLLNSRKQFVISFHREELIRTNISKDHF